MKLPISPGLRKALCYTLPVAISRHGELSMSEQESRELTKRVCALLGVREPFIRWSGRSRNGRYRLGTILIGPRAWRGVEDCLLHEIAHHVARVRCLREGWTRSGQGPHGTRFQKALLDVVAANGKPYAWATEYRALRRYGIQRQEAA